MAILISKERQRTTQKGRKDMNEREALKKVNALVNHMMCTYERRSHRAYEKQIPTYFMGCFEAAHQFAYGVIESENIQDAIDLLNDDIHYYSRYDNNYFRGYVNAAKRIVKVMYEIERAYWYDYGIKRVWSLYDFADVANAIN